MKKTFLALVALTFVVGMGTAYAADLNGVTDFSGKSNDRLEIESVGNAANNVYEGTAAGSKRVVEDFNATGKSYDTFQIGKQAPAKPGMKQNWAAQQPSYNAYDTLEIGR